MIDWLNDPLLQKMDPVKKELILNAAKNTIGKSGNSLATTLMTVITTANRKGITFNNEEIQIILNLLKQGKSPKEQQHVDQMVHMVQSMLSKPPKKN